ncbi:hypothetical protein ACIPRL_29975 [Streptomyces sp. NPDC090085]|uniref:hypothetical protein n=1 Tax=Streptomyces sp. NPDC090085 TaxID=3365943 RepID=UPI003816A35A
MNGRALRRGSALLIGTILSAQAVTGCTPAPQALPAAERNESGSIRLLVAPCPDFKIRGVSVFLNGNADPSVRWSVMRETGPGTPSEIDLFSTPDGYRVNEATLTEIQPSSKYAASTRGSIGTKGISGRLDFSPEKVDELDAGKVVTGLDGDKAVNRKDFLKSTPGKYKK